MTASDKDNTDGLILPNTESLPSSDHARDVDDELMPGQSSEAAVGALPRIDGTVRGVNDNFMSRVVPKKPRKSTFWISFVVWTAISLPGLAIISSNPQGANFIWLSASPVMLMAYYGAYTSPLAVLFGLLCAKRAPHWFWRWISLLVTIYIAYLMYTAFFPIL